MAKEKAVKKKSAKKSANSLSDIYDQVARKVDTQGVKLNVAETKRVLACFFDVLEDYKAGKVLEAACERDATNDAS